MPLKNVFRKRIDENKDFDKKFSLRTADYGYHMPDVQKVLAKYSNIIDRLNEVIDEKNMEIERLEVKLREANDELRRMSLEMSLHQVPIMDSFIETSILNEFQKRNSTDSTNSIDSTEIKLNLNPIDIETELNLKIVRR